MLSQICSSGKIISENTVAALVKHLVIFCRSTLHTDHNGVWSIGIEGRWSTQKWNKSRMNQHAHQPHIYHQWSSCSTHFIPAQYIFSSVLQFIVKVPKVHKEKQACNFSCSITNQYFPLWDKLCSFRSEKRKLQETHAYDLGGVSPPMLHFGQW